MYATLMTRVSHTAARKLFLYQTHTHAPGFVHWHHLLPEGTHPTNPLCWWVSCERWWSHAFSRVILSHHSFNFFFSPNTQSTGGKIATSHIHRCVWRECDWSYAGYLPPSDMLLPSHWMWKWISHLSCASNCVIFAGTFLYSLAHICLN